MLTNLVSKLMAIILFKNDANLLRKNTKFSTSNTNITNFCTNVKLHVWAQTQCGSATTTELFNWCSDSAACTRPTVAGASFLE